MRCLLHLDIQRRRGDIIWPFKEGHDHSCRLSAVCLRLFEILTTFKFGAQRRNHIVSTDFDTSPKNRDREGSLSTCDQQFIMNCLDNNRSCKGGA